MKRTYLLASRLAEYERKDRVDQTRNPRKNEPCGKAQGVPRVAPIGLADPMGMTCEKLQHLPDLLASCAAIVTGAAENKFVEDCAQCISSFGFCGLVGGQNERS